MDYLLHHPGSNVNMAEFDKECGVGVVVTAEEIKDAVSVTFTTSYCHTYARFDIFWLLNQELIPFC